MTEQVISTLMRQVIGDIAVGPDRGRDISAEQSQQVMQAMLAGELDEVQAGIFLIALRMKHEAHDELLGALRALQQQLAVEQLQVDDLLILADPFDGYSRYQSMTAFLPSLLAADGQACVFHGVKTVGPKYGITARQIYDHLGMDFSVASASSETRVQKTGWSYIDQQDYAPGLFALTDLRHRIVKRTLLTTLERVLMPCQGRRRTRLALGYVHRAYPEIYTAMAQAAGFDAVSLIKGVEGGLMPAANKPLRSWASAAGQAMQQLVIEQEQKFKQAACKLDQQISAAEIAALGQQVLSGEQSSAEQQLARHNLLQSAALIVISDQVVCGAADSSLANDFQTIYYRLAALLDDGSAHQQFNAHASD